MQHRALQTAVYNCGAFFIQSQSAATAINTTKRYMHVSKLHGTL